MARPRIYDADVLASKMMAYCLDTDNPSVVGFCVLEGMHKDTIYTLAKSNEALTDSIKEINSKQEARTVELAEKGEMPTAWAIFKMKQPAYGWTDKQEIINHNLNSDLDDLDDDQRKAEIDRLLSLIKE